MGVNTRDKRFSMLILAQTPGRVLPHPSGSITAGDRLQHLPLYRGIADPEAGGGPGNLMLLGAA